MEKAAIFDRCADTGIVLQHTLAGADILMSNFGVAHLALWQSNCFARGFDAGMRPVACKFINIGSTRQGDGVALFARIDAPAIHNNQNERAWSPGRGCTHALFLLPLKSISLYCSFIVSRTGRRKGVMQFFASSRDLAGASPATTLAQGRVRLGRA